MSRRNKKVILRFRGGIERERGKLEVQQKRNLRKHACLRIGVCVLVCELCF